MCVSLARFAEKNLRVLQSFTAGHLLKFRLLRCNGVLNGGGPVTAKFLAPTGSETTSDLKTFSRYKNVLVVLCHQV